DNAEHGECTLHFIGRQGFDGHFGIFKNVKSHRFQAVTVGITQGGRTQIVEGLEAGDRIFLELPPEPRRPGGSGFPLP
ncbi:MAG: hypothetical protein AAGC93_26590, partial [Cyanobacteria bacterium P01_F01_bin.53]